METYRPGNQDRDRSDQQRRINLRGQLRRYVEIAEIFTKLQWITLQYRFENGLSHAEIGKRMGVSRGAISNRLARAKRNLHDYHRELRAEAYHEMRRAAQDDEDERRW